MASPTSVIIVGSGVFGLSTAHAMSQHPAFAETHITLVDCWDFEPASATSSVSNPQAANCDTSRIIRSEYPHSAYAALAREAHRRWRGRWGENNRYVEQRLLLSAEGCSMSKPKMPLETINYVKNAYALSCKMSNGGKDGLQILDSPLEIRSLLASSATTSDENEDEDANMLRGYISGDCGWADGGASIEWLRQEVVRSGRVETRTGQVQQLVLSGLDSGLCEQRKVGGVRLGNGIELHADLTIIAAGSHTPHILGIQDLCDVYSEVVAYIQLTAEECNEFRRRKVPIIVNATRCVFAIAPDNDGFLKLGKFSHSGYVDVRQCAGVTVGPRSQASKTTSSEQWSDPQFGWGGQLEMDSSETETGNMDGEVRKTLAEYRLFLDELLGPSPNKTTGQELDCLHSIASRPFAKVRQCWYTDTPSTDFIVDYHPAYAKTLLVATGGSDHAFKFLPIIGEKVAAIALHRRGIPSQSRDDDESLEELCQLWKFPAAYGDASVVLSK